MIEIEVAGHDPEFRLPSARDTQRPEFDDLPRLDDASQERQGFRHRIGRDAGRVGTRGPAIRPPRMDRDPARALARSQSAR